jgi:uncharacterized 2Fe-2S/4Fe-4S cluster protein (DUF4445 family)
MTEYSVTVFPQNIKVNIGEGKSVLDAIIISGILINNICGGHGTCGRCKMILEKGTVSGKIIEESKKNKQGKRYIYACQCYIRSDITVRMPDEMLLNIRKKEIGIKDRFAGKEQVSDTESDSIPLTGKVYLELFKPTLENCISDEENIRRGLIKKLKIMEVRTTKGVLKRLPKLLRESDFRVTATVCMNKGFALITDIEKGNQEKDSYTAVIDIGTTTVAAHIIKTYKNKTVNSGACFNSQSIYGGEVTSRMISAEKNGADVLQKLIKEDINGLITMLTKETGINNSDINSIVCAGNTVMTHFLSGLSTYNIRRNPFIPVTNEPPPVNAYEENLDINPGGILYTIPGISAWVGSDITAGILACDIFMQEEVSLMVDIGTNGEVVIGNKDWLIATSASAGPALEGASVECGMNATDGAIEKVFLKDGKIRYKTINKAQAKGICGSGIIDLVAMLLKEKIIDRTGYFINDNPDYISSIDGSRRYTLCKGDSGISQPVYITENDIENIISAKAAIYSAIKILLKRLSMTVSEIDRVYICGAFGDHIDLGNAISIGLLPDISPEKVEFMGNTAIKGAKMLAVNHEHLNTLKDITEKTTTYDLMGAEDYMEEFRKALFLPHTDMEEFACKGDI